MKYVRFLMFIWLLVLGRQSLTFPQEDDSTSTLRDSSSTKPDIYVKWTDKKIAIDGVLDDDAWQDAEPYENYFFQHEPLDREPSSEKTRIMVLQDNRMLYFGIQCYDSEPEKIFASSMRRDRNYGSGDVLELLLDTFQDNRNCYAFDTNPLGGKGDALISDQGNHVNKQWECVIYMDGAPNETGWAAEFAIPFKSLKYKQGEVVDWNINISRDIKHRQEETYLVPIPRELGHMAKFRGELWGRLRNIRPPKQNFNFEIYPYILTGQTQTHAEHRDAKKEFNSGIDFKYDITTQLALDLTFKTDFAQAEADEEIVNVTRFNIRREEKRDFFLQNAGLFQFGVGSRSQSNYLLFDSRSIGIQDQERIPLLGGGKLTGRVGKYTIAALSMQSEETTLKDGTTNSSANYAAVRLKRDVSNNSHIGLMILNQTTTSQNYSRAFGMDILWNVNPKIRLDASAAGSFAPDVHNRNMAGDFGFILNKEWIDINLRYTYIDSMFNPEMGFVRRPNIRNIDSDITLTKWINNSFLQNIALSSGVSYITDHNQILQTRNIPVEGSVVFRKGDAAALGTVHSYEFVPQKTYIRDILINAGIYETFSHYVNLESFRARPVNGSMRFEWGQLFDGNQKTAALSGSAKATNHLNIDLAYTFNQLDLKNGSLESHVLSTRWTYSFSPDFYTKAYIQWNAADERFSGNIIFDYAYRPKSHIYLVYNEIQDTIHHRMTDRIVMLKMTYLWQI
ncbi:carbohydrate binding family 9 domain-containing protein [candidate division KSB1 bacterium]|nr:carbohydrate binding family 9 domain-containing protein [candidate division KSB1 bacterium]